MLKFVLFPKEVFYYVVLPIFAILIAYFIFTIIYKRKKGTYYYDYVVDYVYSSLGILFCSLLLCLLLGYAIATIQVLYMTNTLSSSIFLAFIIAIIPIIPASFLIYIIIIYIRNLKRKEKLDECIEEREYELKRKEN